MTTANSTVPPWNKGLTAYDRGWRDGHAAGLSERFWPRLRRHAAVAALIAVVPVLWHVAFGRGARGVLYDLLRLPAAFTLLSLAVLAIILLPLWLVLGVVMFWRIHTRHQRILYREPVDEPPFTDGSQ